MKKNISLVTAAVLSLLASTSAQAIQFDGFMTAGATKIVDINYADKGNIYIGGLGDRGITEDLTFERDTRFGLQISSDVTENMSVVAQLLGRGDNNNFNAIIEWAYIDYEMHDVASIHVGKIKQPVFLVNDYVEVGYAYPWIRPPSEVYFSVNPLNTVNGLELLLQFPVGPGTLSFQPYIGSNREDIPNGQGAYFEAENIYGIDIKYAGRGYTVHASNFHCDVNTFGQLNDVDAGSFGVATVDLNGKGDCDVTAAGFNLDLSNVIVYAEWTRRTTTETLSRPFGDQEAFYATLGYRFGKFMPHITFASIDGDASTVTPGAVVINAGEPAAGAMFNFPVAIQTSITAGLRYEVNDSAALKFEYMVVDVETDQQALADANQPGMPGALANYGLFNTNFAQSPPQGQVGIMSVALDVIF